MTFEDDIREMFSQAMTDKFIVGEGTGTPRGFLSEGELTYEVQKVVHVLPVSHEMLHPDLYPAPKVSCWRRARWRLSDWRYRVRMAWDVLCDRHECD